MPPAPQYDSETAAYLSQQATLQYSAQAGMPSGAAPPHSTSASHHVEAASMAPPGMQHNQAMPVVSAILPVKLPLLEMYHFEYLGTLDMSKVLLDGVSDGTVTCRCLKRTTRGLQALKMSQKLGLQLRSQMSSSALFLLHLLLLR